MPDKVAVESIASASSPAIFTKSIPHLIAADVFVTRPLVAGNDHHLLLVLKILGEPIPEFLLR